MKRILSLVIVLSMVLSFASFAAITNVVNFYDQSTGTNYFFGKFEETDEQVGFEIENKEYVLDDEAYKKAQDAGNLFGIGIRDERGILEGTYTATPYSYTGETKTLYEDLAVVASSYTFERNILETLTIKGEEIAAFSPYKSFYHYVLEDGETLSLSDIEAVPAMSLSTSTVTETENGFLVTTTSDYSEPKTVEIITVEKGEYQENQVAELAGYKTMKLYYDESKEAQVAVTFNDGGKSIYDNNLARLKSSYTQNIIDASYASGAYGLAMIQYDISDVTNINDKVKLSFPAYINSTEGELAILGVDNELPIKTMAYYEGDHDNCTYNNSYVHSVQGPNCTGKGSEIYAETLKALQANTYGDEAIKTVISNAINMVDTNKLTYEVAPRVAVTTASTSNIAEFDVTDYVRSKVLAGEETVTFLVRAIQNSALITGNKVPTYEAMLRIDMKASELSFKGYEGDVALSDLKVNGETIADFNKDTYAYNVIVNGSTETPVVEAFVSDSENLSVKVTQATGVPGSATIKVMAYDGQSKTYTVNFTAPFERGTFTLNNAYRMERTPGTVNFARFVSDITNSETYSGRVYNAKGDPREEALIKFTTTAEGLNADDNIILTVAARAEDSYGVGATVRIVGTVDEKYVYNTVVPVVDRNYTFTTSETLTMDFKQFSFDVTSYVKARLLNGDKQVSFLVELVDSDWQKGDGRNGGGSVYMPMVIKAPYDYVPTLKYKETALTELAYDGNAIELTEGKSSYVVVLEEGSAAPYVTAAAEDGYRTTVTQANEFPGVAEIVVSKNGLDTVYKVNFTTAKTEGSANLLAGYTATRGTTYGELDSNAVALDIDVTTNPNYQIRTQDNGRLRQEATFKFDINNMIGLEDGKKVMLTVYGYGDDNAKNGDVKLVARSTVGEGIDVGKKYATVVDTEVQLAINPEATSRVAHVFDVTELVKAKIEEGETTASFTIKITEGVGGATFYLYYTVDDMPTLTIE